MYNPGMDTRFEYQDPEGQITRLSTTSREQALTMARPWVEALAPRPRHIRKTTVVTGHVVELFPEGDVYLSHPVQVVREPMLPRCRAKNERHDWQAPVGIVGGSKDQPGLRDRKDGGMVQTRVCARCGAYRVIDNHDPTVAEQPMETIAYPEPDTISHAWAHGRSMARPLLTCVNRMGLDTAQAHLRTYLRDDSAGIDLFSGQVNTIEGPIEPDRILMARIVSHLQQVQAG